MSKYVNHVEKSFSGGVLIRIDKVLSIDSSTKKKPGHFVVGLFLCRKKEWACKPGSVPSQKAGR